MYHILLVEDEKDAAELITDVLQRKGYMVAPAYSGKEALAVLEKDKFGLIMIDLLLPDMNGSELCGMLRHDIRFKNIPIIISTGFGDEFNKRLCAKLGINEFLAKPYTIEELLSAVKRLLQ